VRKVKVPVHVIAFAEDMQAPAQEGEEVARLISGASLHLLEGMGHGS
jgi:thioesterase CepJ